MSDLHIDDFFRDAAKILAVLYAQFPKPLLLCVEDVCGPDAPDDFGLPSPRHQGCFQAMIWLASAGYLNYGQTVRQEALDQAVLSHKGFLLLNSELPQAPHQFNPQHDAQTPSLPNLVIHQIRDLLRHASSARLNQTMHLLLLKGYS
jgi:hypothetical protein